MHLLVPQVVRILKEAHVKAENLPDERIIANVFEKIKPPLIDELKEKFGDDLTSKQVNSLDFCQLVKIYEGHLENEKIFNLFIKFQSMELKKPLTDEEVIGTARDQYDQFICAARDLARHFYKYRLHEKDVVDLVTTFVHQDSVEGDVPLKTLIWAMFLKDNPYMKQALPKIFGSHDSALIVLLSTVIDAADIERKYNKADIFKPGAGRENMMKDAAFHILQVPIEMRASPESIIAHLTTTSDTAIEDFNSHAEAMGLSLKDFVAAAIPYCSSIPDQKETIRRVEGGEAKGST